MGTPIRTSSNSTAGTDSGARGSIDITVVHTHARATLRALKTAAQLTRGLAADIRVLVLQVVPYPLALETPDVPVEFTQQRLTEMVSRVNAAVHLEIHVGRDRRLMLESAIKPGSVVLLGGRRRWWPTPASRVARLLERLGHEVIATGSE